MRLGEARLGANPTPTRRGGGGSVGGGGRVIVIDQNAPIKKYSKGSFLKGETGKHSWRRQRNIVEQMA